MVEKPGSSDRQSPKISKILIHNGDMEIKQSHMDLYKELDSNPITASIYVTFISVSLRTDCSYHYFELQYHQCIYHYCFYVMKCELQCAWPCARTSRAG